MIESLKEFFPGQYVFTLVLFILLAVVFRLCFLLLGRLTMKFSSKGGGDSREKNIISAFSRALSVLSAFIALPLSLRVSGIQNEIIPAVNRLSYTVITISIVYAAYALIDRYILRSAHLGQQFF
jgi:hypothetical protein